MNMNDNKVEALWLRACKSKNPIKRLHSVYRRLYLGSGIGFNETEHERNVGIVHICMPLVIKYSKMTMLDLVNAQYRQWFHKDETYNINEFNARRNVEFIMEAIRFTPACDLPDLIKRSKRK